MVQRLITKRFTEEVEEYLNLKSNATRGVYSSAFELFREFYQSKYGEGKDMKNA
jgi:hypothetical protein